MVVDSFISVCCRQAISALFSICSLFLFLFVFMAGLCSFNGGGPGFPLGGSLQTTYKYNTVQGFVAFSIKFLNHLLVREFWT